MQDRREKRNKQSSMTTCENFDSFLKIISFVKNEIGPSFGLVEVQVGVFSRRDSIKGIFEDLHLLIVATDDGLDHRSFVLYFEPRRNRLGWKLVLRLRRVLHHQFEPRMISIDDEDFSFHYLIQDIFQKIHFNQ